MVGYFFYLFQKLHKQVSEILHWVVFWYESVCDPPPHTSPKVYLVLIDYYTIGHRRGEFLQQLIRSFDSHQKDLSIVNIIWTCLKY